jgi:Putative MetA-pathway of phenol degradation
MVRAHSWKRLPVTVALVLAALLVAAPSFGAAAKQFALGLGVDFASGDYGTDTTTRSVRVPLTVDYFATDRLDFELIVPYLYQNNSNTVFAGGMRFPTNRGGGGGGMMQSGVNASSSQSGLGDTTLTAGYLLQKESASLPAVRPLLYLKFPTGDKDKGLGTGELDLGAGIGASKWFGPWYTFVEGRYIFQGSNSDLGLKDYATLEGEAGYRVNRRFLPSVDLWYSSAPSDAASDQVEARLKGKYWVSDAVRLDGYLGKGLTSQAADFTIGGAVFYSF